MSNEEAREILPQLDDQWKTLKMGNPIPGLYPQHGAEQVRIKGRSITEGDIVRTEYTIVVSDQGKIIGTYKVTAEESKEMLEELYKEDNRFR